MVERHARSANIITANMFDVARAGAIFGPKASTPGGISLMPSSGSRRTRSRFTVSAV